MDERTQDTGRNPDRDRTAFAEDELVRPEPVDDPGVAALVEDLRTDEPVLEDDVVAASEHIGTGTDR